MILVVREQYVPRMPPLPGDDWVVHAFTAGIVLALLVPLIRVPHPMVGMRALPSPFRSPRARMSRR